jgi:hypothetical protein
MMRPLMFFTIGIILFSCSAPKRAENQNDSIPGNDTTQQSNETSNSIPDKTEFKTYTGKNLKLEEKVLWTMKGQDAFYKLISTIKAFDASSGVVLWDSTFQDEAADSLRFPFLYTSSPACCASENGYVIRDALTGKAIARYTYLENIDERFDFKIGYNSARAFNFKYNQRDPKNRTLMGEVFTYDGKVNSLLQVRHLGDTIDYSLTPEIKVVPMDSVQEYVSGHEIFINRSKANSIPSNKHFLQLQYWYYPHVKVFLPIDLKGNIDLNYITRSNKNEFLFEFVKR